ncbi:MAG: hypothetical protein ABSH56_28065 [Bryobacteraceae bacterium]|jgi:hypothetical protein
MGGVHAVPLAAGSRPAQTSRKTPHPDLFLHPQYNTWIELTYNQDQKDVLVYARAIGANRYPKGVLTSVVTSNAAIEGHFKTGQRTASRTELVVPRR